MARAIVRFSMNGETSGVTTNRVRGLLEKNGVVPFDRHGTSSYEADGDLKDIVDVLKLVADQLASPPGGGTLDHLWIYVDSSHGGS